ncbi:MAG: glycosyltransferase [Candidatus Melainabacteria bacterium]|nr:glycosyltransferase [Candidatus Melainabacteria bacterium]
MSDINKTAIIMVACDEGKILRSITETSLGNIEKYTKKEEYELILVDNNSQNWNDSIVSRYNIYDINTYIPLHEDIGVSASRNLGAEKSDKDSKYFCFIDNDVFVWEGWLTKLRSYLEKGWDFVMPAQGPISREYVERAMSGIEEKLWDDAGLVLIKREAFEKMGGYDKEFKSIFHELAFRNKMGRFSLQGGYTNQVIITHICGATTVGTGKIYTSLRDEETVALNKIGR